MSPAPASVWAGICWPDVHPEEGGDGGAWALSLSLPSSDLLGWSRTSLGKAAPSAFSSSFSPGCPCSSGWFGVQAQAPRSHQCLNPGLCVGTTAAHGDGDGAGPAWRGTQLKACRDRQTLVVPQQGSDVWHARLCSDQGGTGKGLLGAGSQSVLLAQPKSLSENVVGVCWEKGAWLVSLRLWLRVGAV